MKKTLFSLALLASSSLHAGTYIIDKYLASRDFEKVAAELTANPSVANQVLSDGTTPLHELAMHTPFTTVFNPFEAAQLAEILLLAGAQARAIDRDGNTPLHIAARSGSVGIANMLHHHGASSTTKNNAGDTPQDIAERQSARATPNTVGIDGAFRSVALDLLRITTPSPNPAA